MVNCYYPNCRAAALWVPVVELPTIRTNPEGDLVHTTEPTYLLGKEVCQAHRGSYNFFDWFKMSDWEVMREAARHYGLSIPRPDLLIVQFKPVGWEPKHTIEVER